MEEEGVDNMNESNYVRCREIIGQIKGFIFELENMPLTEDVVAVSFDLHECIAKLTKIEKDFHEKLVAWQKPLTIEDI